MTLRIIPSVLRIATLIILTVTVATAKIIHVPANQPTIQAGINAASNGDTVLVAPGTYYENISVAQCSVR